MSGGSGQSHTRLLRGSTGNPTFGSLIGQSALRGRELPVLAGKASELFIRSPELREFYEPVSDDFSPQPALFSFYSVVDQRAASLVGVSSPRSGAVRAGMGRTLSISASCRTTIRHASSKSSIAVFEWYQAMSGATRYNKLVANHLALVQLASIRLCCELMSPRPS